MSKKNSPPPMPNGRGAPPPLDPAKGNWVWSMLENRWHWVEDSCRYAPNIDDWNRQWRWDTPPEDTMCRHCLRKWLKATKRAS